MELAWLVRALLRRWYIVLIPPLIVGVYIAYQLVITPPVTSTGYTTVVRFTAAQSIDALPNRDGDFQDVWLSSELAVRALTSWALTSSFREEIEARAAAQGVTSDLDALAVVVDQQRSVGQLFLSWNDPDELAVIAQAALNVLREDSQRYFPQFGEEPAQVTVLDEIRVLPAPPPLVDRYEPVVRLGLAVMIGVGLALLGAYFDPTLRTGEEVRQTGLEVIVSVPRE